MKTRAILHSCTFAAGIFVIGTLAATRAVPFAPPAHGRRARMVTR